MSEEYTGETIPTYVSGSGLAAETFGDRLEYDLYDMYIEPLKKYSSLFDEDGCIKDTVLDDFTRANVGVYDLLAEFHEMKLLDVIAEVEKSKISCGDRRTKKISYSHWIKSIRFQF